MKSFIFLLLTIILFASLQSCSDGKEAGVPTTNHSTFIDTLPGTAPHLTKDAEGNVVLSWIKEFNDSSFVFCYAVSFDGGKTFGTPVTIPASNDIKPHSENLPKVLFKPTGEIMAIWGAASANLKNKYAGSVYYAQSFDKGKTWTSARKLVTDTAGYDQRYFDVALLPNGEAGIIWLDNRKDAGMEGSSLYYAVTNGSNGFSNEKRITQSCCQCCRTDLYIDKQNGIHVLYRGIIQDSIRDMVHSVSADGGKTFSIPERISNDNWVLNACPHTGPAMTENNDELHFAWYTGGHKKGTFYTRLTNAENKFAHKDSVSIAGKHPQMTAAPNGDIAIVWDEYAKRGNGSYSRIGMQTRTSEGKSKMKHFITPDTAHATYPVITITNTGKPIVAYCQKRNNKNYIAYTIINKN